MNSNRNAANPLTIRTLKVKVGNIVSQVQVEKKPVVDLVPHGACQQVR